MRIEFSKSAKKELEKMQANMKKLIRSALQGFVVLAWDPDFTKVTPAEAERIRLAEDEFQRGEVFSESDINWE